MRNIAALDFHVLDGWMRIGSLFMVPLVAHHAWVWAEARRVVTRLAPSARGVLAAIMVYGIVTLYAGSSDFLHFQF